jgi:hypothetical protein
MDESEQRWLPPAIGIVDLPRFLVDPSRRATRFEVE